MSLEPKIADSPQWMTGDVRAMRLHWRNLIRQLAHPAVELTLETFAPVMSAFYTMERRGIRIDPAHALSVLMRKLAEQMADARREGCIDDAEDPHIELDGPDEDVDEAHDHGGDNPSCLSVRNPWRLAMSMESRAAMGRANRRAFAHATGAKLVGS
jgi:hypothetical protein